MDLHALPQTRTRQIARTQRASGHRTFVQRIRRPLASLDQTLHSSAQFWTTAPEKLFEGSYLVRTSDLARQYDVTSDSRRFLMIKRIPCSVEMLG